MEQLLKSLNNNFSVSYCGSFVNQLYQPVERVIICDRAYSIRQQDTNLFEVLSTEEVQSENAGFLGLIPSQVVFKTTSNLTADEVVAFFAKESEVYLNNILTNPLVANHLIGK